MPDSAWVAVGGSSGLAPGKVMPAIVRGTELAVWRDPDGAVHAWRNQCPHRGMRLSFGYVDQDGRLVCRYHGWRYGADGKCAAIPAHPDRPPPDDVSVAAYTSAERDGLIWVALSDAPPLLTIARPEERLLFCRSLVVHAGAQAIAGQGIAPGVVRSDTDDGAVILALQPIDPARTGVHLLAVANGTDETARRLEVAAWGWRLRRRVEAGVAGHA